MEENKSNIDYEDAKSDFKKLFEPKQKIDFNDEKVIRDVFAEDNLIVGENQDADELLQDLKCPICIDVTVNPQECQECENLVCKQCIEKWLDDNNSCPHCKKNWRPKNKIHRSFATQRANLKFKCKCDHFLSFENYQSHMSSCKVLNGDDKKDFKVYKINDKEIDSILIFIINYCKQRKIKDIKINYDYQTYQFTFKEDGGIECVISKLVLDLLSDEGDGEKIETKQGVVTEVDQEFKYEYFWGFLADDQFQKIKYNNQQQLEEMETYYLEYLLKSSQNSQNIRHLFDYDINGYSLKLDFKNMIQINTNSSNRRFIKRMKHEFENSFDHTGFSFF